MFSRPSPEQIREQTLALAAVVQAVSQVDQIARTGLAEPAALEASIHSVLSFEASNTIDIFGGVEALEVGLRALRDLLSGNDYGERRAVTRYCMGALYLQGQLRKDDAATAIVRNRLQHAGRSRDFGSDINALCLNLADIYQDTLSKYRFRIQVGGSAQHLQNPTNAARIRALLLAAVRAAYLWQQAGGNRWTLILRRNRLFTEAKHILNTEIAH